jgi:peptidoglycan/LPS O-acetylase OafA/YrhL
VLGALLIFAAAAGLLWAQRGFATERRTVALLFLAFAAVEAILIARFSFAAQIKRLLAAAPIHGVAVLLGLGAVAGLLGYSLVRWRVRWLEALGRRPLAAILLCFFFCSALLPLSKVALLFLCILVAC